MRASSEFNTLSGVLQPSPCSLATCGFDLAPFRRGAFGFSFGAALFAFFITGFSSFALTVRDACRVLSLVSVSIEAGVVLVVRFVVFTSGSEVGFAVVLERPLFSVFGTS